MAMFNNQMLITKKKHVLAAGPKSFSMSRHRHCIPIGYLCFLHHFPNVAISTTFPMVSSPWPPCHEGIAFLLANHVYMVAVNMTTNEMVPGPNGDRR